MLVYTKQKFALSLVLILSVVANLWFMWRYWVNVPTAERAQYEYLFPGFMTDESSDIDIASTLRYSYVFVHPVGPGYELAMVDRHDCSIFQTMAMTKEQLVEPSLYAFAPILVDQYSVKNGEITLLTVRQDSFAALHLDDLKAACPDVKRVLSDRNE